MHTMRIGWLQGLIAVPINVVSVIDSKISEHRELLCAHPQHYRTFGAKRRDHDRWYKATKELLAKIRALQQREQAASLHLHPPVRNRSLWRIRNARRNRKLRRDFDAVDAQLGAEFDAALSDYQKQAGDLSAYVDEQERRMAKVWQQEDERWRRQTRGSGSTASGPSSTYGSDAGGASGFAGGSF